MSIRIIGCGAMGGAIAQVLAENGQKIYVYDKHLSRAEGLARAIPMHVCQSPLEQQSPEDTLLLAIKPQDFKSSIKDLSPFEGKLIVSIMTGLTIQDLKTVFPTHPILRMMPNLPVRYGDGMIALAEDPALKDLKEHIETTFSSLGLLRWFPEHKFDAVTALTGSGPAFVFAIIETMVDAAISMGLTAQEGYELAKQMMGGALTTLYESNDLPSELKWRVCSPNGTTIAGLRKFEAMKVRSGIIETFLSAYQKAQDLKT